MSAHFMNQSPQRRHLELSPTNISVGSSVYPKGNMSDGYNSKTFFQIKVDLRDLEKLSTDNVEDRNEIIYKILKTELKRHRKEMTLLKNQKRDEKINKRMADRDLKRKAKEANLPES